MELGTGDGVGRPEVSGERSMEPAKVENMFNFQLYFCKKSNKEKKKKDIRDMKKESPSLLFLFTLLDSQSDGGTFEIFWRIYTDHDTQKQNSPPV